MEIIIIVALVIVFLVISLLIPVKYSLTLAILTSVFQFYTVAVGGFYPSIAILTSLLLWPQLFKQKDILFLKPVTIFILLMVTFCLSLTWSPDIRLGIRTIIYSLPFIFVFAASYRVARFKPRFITALLSTYFGLVSVEAVLVIVFRILPALETKFLYSNLANFFISPNTLQDVLFSFNHNNVLDPYKAGGFFINGNVAAAFLGANAFLSYALGRFRGKRWLVRNAFLLYMAVFFTGSKAGIILGAALLLFSYGALQLIKASRNHDKGALANLKVIIGSSSFLFGLLGFSVIFLINFGISLPVPSFLTNFGSGVDTTLGSRFIIWQLAYKAFLSAPILGQGYGGWEVFFSPYAALVGFQGPVPPHDTLIYLWSQNGIIAVFLGLLFYFSILSFSFLIVKESYKNLNLRNASFLVFGVIFAFAWVFIQGFGENYGLFGDSRICITLASTLGFAYAEYIGTKKEYASEKSRNLSISAI